MHLWFAVIGVLIFFIFWLINKLSDAFERQERKLRAEVNYHWYEERDKAIDDDS
jgi:hypothetical protein